MSASEQELLQCIKRSPETVAVHDREGWLSLFDEDGLIEDPVGSDPVFKSDGTLGRFWDTFIAPHEIRFEVLRDCFLGMDVMRDTLIHTTVAPGLTVVVEAYLLYQVRETAAGLRVRRMAAHWSLPKMSALALSLGPRAMLSSTKLTLRMASVLGPAWFAGYLAAPLLGAGRSGERALEDLVRAVNARDAAGLESLAEPGATAETRVGRRPLSELAHAFGGAALAVERLVCAGQTVTFRYRVGGDPARGGLGLLELGDFARVRSARFFA